MASGMDKLAKELKTMMNASDDRKPKPYDTQAEVLRVEDGVAWVHIPGGVEETPVRLTMDAKKGDMVNIHVANGSAWITGNGTSPPTDNTVANIANDKATAADEKSNKALDASIRAALAADEAEKDAKRASDAADVAEGKADDAMRFADEALTYANEAADNAGIAKQSADSAVSSANTALDQLGIIENVVGVLDLISQHGDYKLTEDPSVVPDKWYFTRSGTSPNYIYTVVKSPTGDPSAQGWYELIGVDEAIQNYVSSQLVVDNDGLWLKTAGMDTKVQLSATDGVVLHGPDGKIVGKYGETAQIGNGSGFHIDIGVWYKLTTDTAIDTDKTYYIRSGIEPDYVYTAVVTPDVSDIGTYYEQQKPELGFYDGPNKVAYISNQQLYIEQSVVLQQMDVGLPSPNGLGQWSWKVHEVNGRNNLYLKWNG